MAVYSVGLGPITISGYTNGVNKALFIGYSFGIPFTLSSGYVTSWDLGGD